MCGFGGKVSRADLSAIGGFGFGGSSTYALAQKRVHKKSLGALLHLLLFSGFVVLTIGTTLLGIAHDGPYNFHHGWYYLIYELTMDVFGVAFCLGCILAMYRRAFQRPASLGHNWRDWWLLGLLLSLGLTGFWVEALRMHYTQVQPEMAHWSVVGWLIDVTVLRGIDRADRANDAPRGSWWLHTILVAGFFATIPVNRFLHVITGPLNIAARPERPMGALVPLKMEEVEQTGRTGVAELANFNRQQLLSLGFLHGMRSLRRRLSGDRDRQTAFAESCRDRFAKLDVVRRR